MKTDIAERIHQMLYKKSGRANANAGNVDFEAGFDAGMDSDLDSDEAFFEDIGTAYKWHGEPHEGTAAFERFREWKRGYGAARMQRIAAAIPCGDNKRTDLGTAQCEAEAIKAEAHDLTPEEEIELADEVRRRLKEMDQ